MSAEGWMEGKKRKHGDDDGWRGLMNKTNYLSRTGGLKELSVEGTHCHGCARKAGPGR